MRRGIVRGTVGATALAAIAAGCGGGGGGGGGGTTLGPTYWAIPFVAESAARTMTVNLRNLSPAATAVSLQGYLPSGTPYAGPVGVTLDGDDEHELAASVALGGGAPAGGWILVKATSQLVEAGFNVTEPGKVAEESARAWPLPDLGVAPPTTQGLTITTETTRVMLGNAMGVPILVTVTAYAEPAIDPLLPPVVSTPPAVALAAFETKTFTPDALSGVTGFVGSFQFSAPSPFFAAAEEDLAFDGQPQVLVEARILEVALEFGQETFSPATYTDFALVVRNDADAARTVTINRIRDDAGGAIKITPRSVTLAAFESRVVTTTDATFSDLFGDATLATFLHRLTVETLVPGDVAISWRQFDPVTLSSNMTVHPMPIGHVFETTEVMPVPLLPSDTRTWLTIVNPNTASISVTISSLIPQPDGFDAGPVVLSTVTVPALAQVRFSPDGAPYLDRDSVAQDTVGFRFVGAAPFSVLGRRETRSALGVLTMLSPTIMRDFDDPN